MKKLLAFALILALLLSCATAALAEEIIDFSDYTLDELMDIRTQLAAEIASRPGGEKMVLTVGEYLIGADIPAGAYTIKCIQNYNNESTYTNYCIYETEAMYRYDIDRHDLEAYRELDHVRNDGEKRINLYPGEYLFLEINGAEIARVGNAPARSDDYVPPKGTTIPKGEYTVGEEIPAGTYKIYYDGTGTSCVRVFQDAEEAGNRFNDGEETILRWYNTEGNVTLEEGNIVRVEYSSIIMAKSQTQAFTFD